MKYWQPSHRTGFTLLEVVIAVTLLSIIASFMVLGFRNYAQFQEYEQAADSVRIIVADTRTQARSAVADVPHGVKVLPSQIIRFSGSTYTAGDPNNVVFAFPFVTLTPTLSSGGDEIIFSKLSGLPSATGTILIEGVAFAASTTFSVTDSGIVE